MCEKSVVAEALRLVAGGDFLTVGGVQVMEQAADEIERLQSGLQYICKVLDSSRWNRDVAIGEARFAVKDLLAAEAAKPTTEGTEGSGE